MLSFSPRVQFWCVLAAFLLALLVPLPVFADDTATAETALTLGEDITDAYDQYAGGVDSGLSDIKDSYSGTVSDSVLGFVQEFGSILPAEIWVVVGLSVASMVVLGILRYLKG